MSRFLLVRSIPSLILLVFVILCPSYSQYWTDWVDGAGDVDSIVTLSASDGSHITNVCTKSDNDVQEIQAWFDNGEYGGPFGDGSVDWECFEVQGNECFSSINLRHGSRLDGIQMVTSNNISSPFWGSLTGGVPYVFSGSGSHDCISQLELKLDEQSGNDAFRGIRAYFITITSSPTSPPSAAPTEIPINAPTVAPSNAPSILPTQIPTKAPTVAPTQTPSALPMYSPTAVSSRVPTTMTALSTIISPQHQFTTTNGVASTVIIETNSSPSVSNIDNVRASGSKTSFFWIVYILSVLGVCICICGFAMFCKRKQKRNNNAEILPMRSIENDNIEFGESVEPGKAMKQNEEIKEWMTNVVQLPQYYESLISTGYDRLEFIMDIQSKAELKEIGIEKKGHQTRMISEIMKLKSTSTKVHVDNDECTQTGEPGESHTPID